MGRECGMCGDEKKLKRDFDGISLCKETILKI